MRIFVVVLFACYLFPTQQGWSQSGSSESHEERTREILASFNKTKHEAREKFGVRKEKYKQIHSEAVVRPALLDYVGVYKVPDWGYTIQIARIDGDVTVIGSEPQDGSHAQRRFRLADVSLSGALLAGTKVYEDGEKATFEGVFINMTDTEGVSPNEVSHRATTFGLGVVGGRVNTSGVERDKLFYQFEQ
jgi:hypothetical protein